MPFNGSGTFARVYNWVVDRDSAVKIRADRMDTEMDGFATGLSTCIAKDGQTTITADIPFNSHNITGLAAATASTHAVNFGQIREKLTASRTYYVRTSTAASPGSDSNTGLANTAGGAFLTIQKAINTALRSIDAAGQTTQITVTGTSTENLVIAGPGVGIFTALIIVGDTTTPANCTIAPASGVCWDISGNALVSVSGFKMVGAAGFQCKFGAQVYVGVVEFGAMSAGGSYIFADSHAFVYLSGNQTWSGSAGSFLHLPGIATCYALSITITIGSALAFSNYCVGMASGSNVYLANVTFAGAGVAGTTGRRWVSHYNGTFLDLGSQASTFLPGDLAGLTTEGGGTRYASRTLNGFEDVLITGNVSGLNIAPNAVINGGILISQELGTTGATLVNNTAKYTVDMIETMYNHGAATAVVTSAQILAASFPTTRPGYQNGLQLKATTAISAPANGDFAKYRVKIEGYRAAQFGFGIASAATLMIAFELYSTVSGVALVRLSNSAANRFFYHEVTVAAGWNLVAFTVTGDAAGSWLWTNGIGLTFELFVSGKETTPQSSLDAWGTTAKVQSTNSTNLLGTANNLTILTGLHISRGNILPSASAELASIMRHGDEELDLCLRFWEKTYDYGTALNTASTSNGLLVGVAATTTQVPIAGVFKKRKRAAPTVALISFNGTNSVMATLAANADTAAASAQLIGEHGFGYVLSSGLTAGAGYHVHFTANARL